MKSPTAGIISKESPVLQIKNGKNTRGGLAASTRRRYSQTTVTDAITPSAVEQAISCSPGAISTANGSVPVDSPTVAPSTNHQSRDPSGFPTTLHTIFWLGPPGTSTKCALSPEPCGLSPPNSGVCPPSFYRYLSKNGRVAPFSISSLGSVPRDFMGMDISNAGGRMHKTEAPLTGTSV